MTRPAARPGARSAYVDSSCLVATLLGEPSGASVGRLLVRYDSLIASGLVAAEVLCALVREGVPPEQAYPFLDGLHWLSPPRELRAEIAQVLAHGALRGADTWHLAHALYLAPDGADLDFLTLDSGQGVRARKLGFATPL